LTKKLYSIFLDSWHPYFWLTAVIILVYGRTAAWGFTHYDDHALLIKNYYFLSDPGNILAAFRQNVYLSQGGIYYRPLLTISFMVNSWLAGTGAAVYHVTNIGLHLLAVTLLFLLFECWGYSRRISFFFGMVVAVHPALAQAVAWIPGRNDTLLSIFLSASLLALSKARNRNDWPWYLLHVSALFCALLTKETAAVFPVIFTLYLLLIDRKKLFSRRFLALGFSWIATITLWAVLLISAVHPRGGTYFKEMNTISENLIGLISYIGKAWLPFNLSVLPVPRDLSYLYGLAAILLITILLSFWGVGDRRRLIFGLIWFLILFLPTAVKTSDFTVFFEHRLYIPLAGMLFVAAELKALQKIFGTRLFGPVAGLAIILGYGGLAFGYSSVYRDGLSFWGNAVGNSPHSYCAHGGLGQRYAEAGLTKSAETEFLKALALNPGDPVSQGELGIIYMSQGDHAKAKTHFWAALKSDPKLADIYNNLGHLYLQEDSLKEAERELNKALAINDKIPELQYNLGHLALKKGLAAQAQDAFEKALHLSPSPQRIYYDLGYLYLQRSELEKAEKNFIIAQQQGFAPPELYYNLGVICLRKGDLQKALADFRLALGLRADYLNAQRGIGIAYFLGKDYFNAKRIFQEILRSSPDDDASLYYLRQIQQQKQSSGRIKA